MMDILVIVRKKMMDILVIVMSYILELADLPQVVADMMPGVIDWIMEFIDLLKEVFVRIIIPYLAVTVAWIACIAILVAGIAWKIALRMPEEFRKAWQFRKEVLEWI